MKIAFYINAIHEGGAERVMVNLANAFVNKGDEIILITSFKDTWEYPYSDKIKRYILGVKPTKNSKFKRNIIRVFELRKILKEEKPDCLISFMAEANYRGIIASLGLNNKVIISVRNDPNVEYRGAIGKVLGKFLLPLADGCVFQTLDAQKWFPKRLQKKSKIIYNAVKDEFFNIERNVEKNTVVTCGRLEKQKNHKLLINAFEIVLYKHPDARLLIFGEGSLRHELEDLIKNKNLNRNIKLCGNSNDIPKMLSNAEIFVLSSNYEGMPNALMEALAAGVPSISTNCPCGGPEMLIKNHENGILINVGDIFELSKSISYLLDFKKISREIGYRAKKRALEFKSNKIYNEWYEYINDFKVVENYQGDIL